MENFGPRDGRGLKHPPPKTKDLITSGTGIVVSRIPHLNFRKAKTRFERGSGHINVTEILKEVYT